MPPTHERPARATLVASLVDLARRHRTTTSAAAVVLGALAITILAWPVVTLRPAPGLDPSWQYALQEAAVAGLDQGRDVAFTYGPLGFLAAPTLWFDATGIPAVLFAVASTFALALAILLCARPGIDRIVGAAAALALLPLVVAGSGAGAEALAFVALLACAAVIQRPPPVRVARWAPWALGALAAVALLTKLSTGVLVVLLVAIAVWFLPPGGAGGPLRALLAFVATFLVVWIGTGNPLGAVPDWIATSREIGGGFAEAMSLRDPARADEVWAFWVIAAAALVLTVAAAVHLERVRAVALVLLSAGFVLMMWKRGFVRHDEHSVLAFAGLAALVLAVRVRGWARAPAVAVLGAAIAMTAIAAGEGPGYLDPGPRVARAAQQVPDLLSGSSRDEIRERGEADIRGAFPVDRATLATLRGHTVHVDPWELSVAWAYDLDLVAPPVPQAYSAYTPALDEMNARFLSGPDAPERILRHDPGGRIDERSREHESPAYNLAMICNYAQIRATEHWQVLARVPDRCGAALPIERIDGVASDEPIVVPPQPPADIVFARVHLPEDGIGRRIADALGRPEPAVHEIFDGVGYHRVVRANLGGPLLLVVPESAGFEPRFGGAVRLHTIAFRTPGPYDIELYRMRLRPAAAPLAGSSGAAGG